MWNRLTEVEKRYEEITQRLYDPAVVADVEEYRKLTKESKELEPLVERYREYRRSQAHYEEARRLLESGGLDRELRELAELELAENREKMEAAAEEMKILLLPGIPTTSATSSWRSARERAARNPPCSPPPSIGCTPCTPSAGVTAPRWRASMKPSWAAIRRSALWSPARVPTVA